MQATFIINADMKFFLDGIIFFSELILPTYLERKLTLFNDDECAAPNSIQRWLPTCVPLMSKLLP